MSTDIVKKFSLPSRASKILLVMWEIVKDHKDAVEYENYYKETVVVYKPKWTIYDEDTILASPRTIHTLLSVYLAMDKTWSVVKNDEFGHGVRVLSDNIPNRLFFEEIIKQCDYSESCLAGHPILSVNAPPSQIRKHFLTPERVEKQFAENMWVGDVDYDEHHLGAAIAQQRNILAYLNALKHIRGVPQYPGF